MANAKARVVAQAVAGIVLVLLLVGAAMGGAAVHAYLSTDAEAEVKQQSTSTPAYVAEDPQEHGSQPHPNQVANERELDCGIGRVMAEDGTCVSESFYEAQAKPKPVPQWATPAGKREMRQRIAPCAGNKLMAEDGSCVPPSFYHTQLKREAHKQRMKQPKADGTCRGNRVMAEDRSCVPPDYWSKTDTRPVKAAVKCPGRKKMAEDGTCVPPGYWSKSAS